MLSDLGYGNSDADVEKIFREADQNFDNNLSFAEFYKGFHGKHLPYWYRGKYSTSYGKSYTVTDVKLAEPPVVHQVQSSTLNFSTPVLKSENVQTRTL